MLIRTKLLRRIRDLYVFNYLWLQEWLSLHVCPLKHEKNSFREKLDRPESINKILFHVVLTLLQHFRLLNTAITPVKCCSPLGLSWRGAGPTRSPCAKSRWPGHISRVFASPSRGCVWIGWRGTNYPPSSPRSSPGCVWGLTGTPRFPRCGICWNSRPAGWRSARARRRKTPGDWRQSGPVCGMTSWALRATLVATS